MNDAGRRGTAHRSPFIFIVDELTRAFSTLQPSFWLNSLKHVKQVQNSPALSFKELTQLIRVYTRDWYMSADPINNQCQKKENKATPKITVFSCLND